MIVLVLGLVLWSVAHGFRRLAPERRAALTARLGAGRAKGAVALAIAVALGLIVLGYRAAPFAPLWTPPAWTVHLNNLMMLGAVALFGMGRSRGRARSWLRHPMLIGVVVWAAAHLLVNGDVASLVLFGWMALWALAEIAVINASEPVWTRPAPGPASGDLRLALITVVVFAGITAVHALLGHWPFPQ